MNPGKPFHDEGLAIALMGVGRHWFHVCLSSSVLLLATSSCQTDPADTPNEPLHQAPYGFRLGQATDLGGKWGVRQEIFVDWKGEDGVSESRLAYYGYDIDGRPGFEIVERLSADGSVVQRGFDLDFDGRLDALSPDGAEASE